MSRRKFTKEFKQTAIRRLQAGQTAGEVARALEVNPTDLHRWRRELEEHGSRAFRGPGLKRAEESRTAELERKVGRQSDGDRFFKKSLAACGGGAPAAGTEWRRGIYRQIEQEVETGTRLAVRTMCASAVVSRAGFYRSLNKKNPARRDPELRHEYLSQRSGLKTTEFPLI